MASSDKFDISSSSSPLYTSGKRGPMERSSSFREKMENPILSSLPSMSRSTINVSQGDVNNFFQCLRFDLKSMAVEYKCNRHGDYKQLASAALCASDDLTSGLLKGKLPSSSPEDLKRFKVGLRESTIKARERVKVFSEVLSVINKCFPSIPSRKRSRPDSFSGDRSNVLTVGKMGAQSHALTSAFDYEQQRVEERGKNGVPNKRTRTSMVDQKADVRPNTPVRSSGSVERDREFVRLPNGNALQGADRVLPVVGDGWEKAKMKKKRSSSVSAKPVDGTREPKQGIHPRCLPDARSKTNDPYEFRLEAANGGTVSGKADVISKQTGIGVRSSVPRPEQENTSFFHDKRDQISLEQERKNVRALNKANVPEDFISGTPSSTPKLHAAARGPRSGSGVVPKLSQVQRPTFSNGLESPHGTSKNTGAIGSNNRKRSQSTQSSSPPVAQWGDRRPHKIPRTARRTKIIVPGVSSNDEIQASSNSDITVSEKGRGSGRRYLGNSHKQFKSKGDHRQSSTLSESEESGAAEIRSRDSACKSEEVQKMSTLVLPTRKNKFMNEDELTPGVCRQGRTGRGFSSARSVGNVGKVKQLRTGRVGFDKAESKLGRPPTRKLLGRKAPRQKYSTFTTATTDFLSTDDGHEELLAAANAVINPGCALSSPFWRQMDPLFSFVSDAAVAYIKQESILPTANTTDPIDSCYAHPNGTMLFEPPENGNESPEYLTSGSSPRGTSLCQRLLTALISEEDNNDDLKFSVYGSSFEPETNVESDAVNRSSLQNFELDGSYSSGYRIESTLRSCNELVRSQPESHVMDHYQYSNMSMDERILLEIHSLGLYPSRVPDLVHPGDEDVSNDISRLQEKHNHQVSRKKTLLNKLLKSTDEARELQEKDFERLSLEKLTGMAYQKYMSCWGPSAPGGKGANGKMAKQAALDCVKRTLDRCHEFEETGKSCFAEPMFREMFLSGLSRLNDGEVYGTHMENVSGTQITPSFNHDIYSSDSLFDVNQSSEQPIAKENVWSSRVKKRELHLDDVACTSSGMPSSVGRAVMKSAKGKRSERDRDGKGNGPKLGRPSSANANVKGERKTKAKLKQKTTQLSASVNGPLGKISDQQRPTSSSVSKSTEIKSSRVNEKHQTMLSDNSEEPLDLSRLQLPGMDDFGVGDDFGGQGEDIDSWLNIDDDVLQDEDFMGLEIPMDDLTDLNMMV
ncbi:hypothetical protein Tco_1456346 [Tanacetum coccineum]